MRTFVSAIGYNSTSVTRPLLSYGVDPGDSVVLIRPREETDDNRATEAIADVERMLEEIEPEIGLHTERVPHDEFERAVLACSDVLTAAEGELVVNLGGGARDVLLPFTIASIVHATAVDTALFFSDVDGAVREWTLPPVTESVARPVRDTLSIVVDANEAISVPELTSQLDVSKSTVGRHLQDLESAGAVRSWSEGKTKYVEATLAGSLASRSS